jgi:hypothetical protein
MTFNVLRRAIAPAVIGLLALAPSALAATGDSATGAGAETFPGGFTREFDFDASIGSTGFAAGRMTLREVQVDGTTDTIQADVVCLAVSGASAQVVGRITASPVPAGLTGAVGSALIFDVSDQGTPGAGRDRFAASYTGAAPAATCGSPLADVTIDRGEITVGGAVAPPPPPPPPPPVAQPACAAGVGVLRPRAEFGFMVRTRRDGSLGGELMFESRGRVLRSRAFTSLVVSGADATFQGTGRTNRGRTVAFTVNVHDGGRRGRGDTFAITFDGFDTGGPLKGGDVAVCASGGGGGGGGTA